MRKGEKIFLGKRENQEQKQEIEIECGKVKCSNKRESTVGKSIREQGRENW